MNYDDYEKSAGDGTNRMRAGASESLLRAEIRFWRELLSESDGSLPVESIERMRQALALAEQRFLQLLGEHSTGQRPSNGPARSSQPVPRLLH